MSRGGRWIAVLVVLFAASFGAGAATSDTGEKPHPGAAARPLDKPASARIDPLGKASGLPALRRPARANAPPPAQTAPAPPPSTPDASPGTTQPPPAAPPGPVLPPEAAPE